MSEEATHASRAVPMGIILSCGLCGILGFLSLAVIAACMDKNLVNLLGSAFGQPMAQIYYDSLGKPGALGFMAVVAIVQFFMGLSIVSSPSLMTANEGANICVIACRRLSPDLFAFRAVLATLVDELPRSDHQVQPCQIITQTSLDGKLASYGKRESKLMYKSVPIRAMHIQSIPMC